MPRSTRFTTTVTVPTYVERTALPRISLHGQGAVRYHAYVQSYVAGAPVQIKGTGVTPLFSLSLVAMRGHGAVLKGLWSSLVAHHLETIFIDGLDRVALAQHVLPDLRYQLHWNYHQDSLESGELHAIIESQMLSMCDPIRAMAAPQRARRRSGSKKQAATMTRKDEADKEQSVLRQLFPMFVLFAPGSIQPHRVRGERDEVYEQRCQQALASWRIHQHFAFLDPRYPFPLAPEWAEYLWQRGRNRQEILRLKTWSPSVVQNSPDAGEGESPPHTVPFFLEAWLCRPDPLQIKLDLDHARERGELVLPEWPGAAAPVRAGELVGSLS